MKLMLISIDNNQVLLLTIQINKSKGQMEYIITSRGGEIIILPYKVLITFSENIWDQDKRKMRLCHITLNW